MSFQQLKYGQRERSGSRNKATGSRKNKWKSAAGLIRVLLKNTKRSSQLFTGRHFLRVILWIRTSYCSVPSVLGIYKSHSSRNFRPQAAYRMNFLLQRRLLKDRDLRSICLWHFHVFNLQILCRILDRWWYTWSISVIFHSNLWAVVIEAQYDSCDDFNPCLSWLHCSCCTGRWVVWLMTSARMKHLWKHFLLAAGLHLS